MQCVFCPEEYSSDPESGLLCQLWEDLVTAENMKDSTTSSSTTSSSSSSSSSSSPSSPTTVENIVECPHEDNPTSNEKLCDLWCDLQSYNGSQCSTTPPCPSLYTESSQVELLCSLWTVLKEFESQLGASQQNVLGSLPVTCQFVNQEDGDLLCELWCQIQEYENKTCVVTTTTTTSTTEECFN